MLQPAGWTEERVERLKQMWADGASCSAIAAELGGGLSRNAVIGKVHRMGMSGRAKVNSPYAKSGNRPRNLNNLERKIDGRKRRATAPFSERGRALHQILNGPEIEVEAYVEPELIDNTIPIGQRCSLLQLSEATCHWPIGDPQDPSFFFCGGKSVPGLPYCAHHCRMAYQPVVDRRVQRRMRAAAEARP